MTKVQTIIEEISQLGHSELEQVLEEVLSRLDRKKKIDAILAEYAGIGEGVWKTDAQEFVDRLREERE
ncbi:MAG: hypothetical protein NXI25_08430 [bacterium]|nr:hypothetical protein [bacterium]